MSIQTMIEREVMNSTEKYGNYNSTHEMYAVLLEEVQEVWEIVKKNTENCYGTAGYKAAALVPELIQIAAIATKAINELQNNKIKHV